VPDDYLAGILFFRRFAPAEIAALRAGLRVVSAPRGASIPTDEALWIVLCGAAQTLVGAGGRANSSAVSSYTRGVSRTPSTRMSPGR
jgi:hypothetical protein